MYKTASRFTNRSTPVGFGSGPSLGRWVGRVNKSKLKNRNTKDSFEVAEGVRIRRRTRV